MKLILLLSYPYIAFMRVPEIYLSTGMCSLRFPLFYGSQHVFSIHLGLFFYHIQINFADNFFFE